MQSERFTLNKEDLNKWIHNSLVFLAPAMLLLLTEIQLGKSLDEALVAIKLWALNTAVDLLKKFIAKN